MQFGGRKSQTELEFTHADGRRTRYRTRVSEGQVNVDRVVAGFLVLGVLEVVTTVVLVLVN